MKTSTIVWILVVIIIVGGGIYWFSMQNSTTPSTTSQTTTTTTTPAAATLNIGSNAQFPNYLTASNGMALYTYDKDTSGVSNCTGGCATAWPPYTVSSTSGLMAATGITGTIGTVTRSDGTIQVTYNGMPLYFFAQDTNAGEVTGNGEGGFSVATAVASTSAAPTTTTSQTTVNTGAGAAASAPTTPVPSSGGYNY